jgi:prephenate dehydratase
MRKLHVGFQGEFGAYSELAAEKVGTPVPFPSFERVFEAVLKKQVDCAVIPIANAVAGIVKENAQLLWHFQRRVKIVAETIIPISHCLIGLPESTIEKATEVHSHWQALAQCQKFFRHHTHLKPIETYDTAGSAKILAKTGNTRQLVIASERAAKQYGLCILKHSINDVKWNKTQFYFIARKASSLELSAKKEKSVVLCQSLSEIQRLIPRVLRCEAVPTRKRAFESHYLIEVSGEMVDSNSTLLGMFGRID